MELTLPDDLLRGQNVTEEQLLFNLALGLYIDGKVTLGRAALIAGMPKSAFLDELGQRRIPVHYDADDLESDLQTLRALERKSES